MIWAKGNKVMNYALDLGLISMREYKELLIKQNLLLGRRILLENIDDNFAFFVKMGIDTVRQMNKNLSTPTKIADLSASSGISKLYLVILKREIGSLVQKPVPINNFPSIDSKLLSSLNSSGIKTSKDYWEIKQDLSDDLFCLCDLVRINGVGPIAAKAFFESGYKSVKDVAAANAAVMLAKVSAVNEEKHYYKAKLGQKDMQFCIDFARLINKYSN